MEQPLPRERARSVHTIATESIFTDPVDDPYLLGLQATARARQAALEAPPAAVEPSEATPIPARPTAIASTAHKRQISEAIASNERPNAPGEKQEDPEAEAGLQDTRKSGRARKPKLRN